MKRLMKYTAVVLATVGLLYLLWQFRLVALLFILSLFVAAMFRPLVAWLMRKGLSRTGAQFLTYLIAGGGLLLLIILAGEWLITEFNGVANQSVIAYERLHRTWQEGAAWQQTVAGNLPAPFAQAAGQERDISEMLPAVMQVTAGTLGLLGGILLVLALGLYWSVDQYRFERLWLSLLPAQRRAYARDSWREIEAAAGNYLRSQTVQSVLAALALGVVGWAAGYPYPALWALAGALGSFIPLFGGLLTAFVAFALGNLESSGIGVAAALYTLLVFAALELVVEPRLWPRNRRSLLLTILLIVPLVDAFGVLGLVAAPLLAAVSETIIKQTYKILVIRRGQRIDLDDLVIRQRQLTAEIAGLMENEATPELQNLSQRLGDLLAESETTTGSARAEPPALPLESEPAGSISSR